MNIGYMEILLVAGAALLLFGAKKLPDAARSIGQSVNAFKQGLKEGGEKKDEEKKEGEGK